MGLFSNWSMKDVEAHNARVATKNQAVSQLPAPEPKRRPAVEPLDSNKGAKESPTRFLVRIESRRRRLLDIDNLFAKTMVDCLRYSGLIPNDRPEDIDLQVCQTKISKGEAESTVIEITPIQK
jgi:hypothetical protein